MSEATFKTGPGQFYMKEVTRWQEFKWWLSSKLFHRDYDITGEDGSADTLVSGHDRTVSVIGYEGRRSVSIDMTVEQARELAEELVGCVDFVESENKETDR